MSQCEEEVKRVRSIQQKSTKNVEQSAQQQIFSEKNVKNRKNVEQSTRPNNFSKNFSEKIEKNVEQSALQQKLLEENVNTGAKQLS